VASALSPKSPPTFAYVALRDHLQSQIREGVYRPGQKLPTEHELMTLTKLSRHTVRSALDELRLQGLITRVPGKGTFVSASPPSSPKARVIGSAASLFGFDLSGRLRIVEAPRRVGSETRADDLAAAEELDHDAEDLGRLSYVRFVGKSPLGMWTVWLPPDVFAEIEHDLADMEAQAKSSVTRLVAGKTRHEAHRAAQLMTAEAASASVAGSLSIDEGDPLLVVQRTYFDSHDTPFEHLVVRYVPKHYAYRLELISGSSGALSDGGASDHGAEPVGRRP
jgi:GntR family transcriptional regulator